MLAQTSTRTAHQNPVLIFPVLTLLLFSAFAFHSHMFSSTFLPLIQCLASFSLSSSSSKHCIYFSAWPSFDRENFPPAFYQLLLHNSNHTPHRCPLPLFFYQHIIVKVTETMSWEWQSLTGDGHSKRKIYTFTNKFFWPLKLTLAGLMITPVIVLTNDVWFH